jgi:hypothetical protein
VERGSAVMIGWIVLLMGMNEILLLFISMDAGLLTQHVSSIIMPIFRST